jgi:hypothetical protein
VGVADHAVPVDDEHRPAVEADRSEDAVRVADDLALVGQQREREPVLGRERLVAGHVLGADAEDLGTDVGEVVEVVVVAGELRRAHGRVVARVEHEHDRLAAQGGQRDGLPAGGREGEVRGDVPDGHGGHVRPPGRRGWTQPLLDERSEGACRRW